nr:uncharacterized protein LOC113736633 [Coffea arabica]
MPSLSRFHQSSGDLCFELASGKLFQNPFPSGVSSWSILLVFRLIGKVCQGHPLSSPTFPPKGRRKSKSDVRERFGSHAGSFALGIGGFPKKLNATIPTGDFTKLDFEAYNGPSRGYSVLFKVKKA